MRYVMLLALATAGCGQQAEPTTVRATTTTTGCGPVSPRPEHLLVEADRSDALEATRASLAARLPSNLRLVETSRALNDGVLRADFKVYAGTVPSCRDVIRLHALPDRVLVSGDVKDAVWECPVETLVGFDLAATAKARVYRGNPRGGLVDVELRDLTSDRRLRSPRFVTVNADGAPLAESVASRFDFPGGDPRLDEATAFANAEKVMAWLQREGAVDPGCAPIELKLRASLPSSAGPIKDNARYLGADETGGLARVELGEGQEMQNLATDFDILAHELGHHVIYRRLKAKTGQARIIHEGLADFLVYAQTGNACLGETVCRTDAAGCSRPRQCLRTAENDKQMTSNAPYEGAEVLSGMLWDVAKKHGLGLAPAGKLTLRAIDHLLPASGFRDLILALLGADLELHDGAHAKAIIAEAEGRGLGRYLDGVSADDYVKRRD